MKWESPHSHNAVSRSEQVWSWNINESWTEKNKQMYMNNNYSFSMIFYYQDKTYPFALISSLIYKHKKYINQQLSMSFQTGNPAQLQNSSNVNYYYTDKLIFHSWVISIFKTQYFDFVKLKESLRLYSKTLYYFKFDKFKYRE